MVKNNVTYFMDGPLPQMARLWPACLMWHGPFLAHLVFANEKAWKLLKTYSCSFLLRLAATDRAPDPIRKRQYIGYTRNSDVTERGSCSWLSQK